MKRLLTDQGREFNNKLMHELLTSINIKHVTTSAYNPRCNGLVERVNRTVNESLRKISESNIDNWDLYIEKDQKQEDERNYLIQVCFLLPYFSFSVC